jgi:hypothetical protein
MGGYYKILPLGLRIVSIGNALFLLFMTLLLENKFPSVLMTRKVEKTITINLIGIKLKN